MAYQYHRQAAVPRKIADIEPEKDARVRLLVKIINKRPFVFTVDDGSRKEVHVDEGMMNTFEIGDVVRIFARVMPTEMGFELTAELVQNMNGLDMELYKKVLGK